MATFHGTELNTDIVNPGTVIAGTLRNEDLIPRFGYEILCIVGDAFKAGIMSVGEHQAFDERIQQIEAGEAKGRTYFDSEDADYDLETLFDMLNELAPEGYYFGAHEGDGSDFGFWAVEED